MKKRTPSINIHIYSDSNEKMMLFQSEYEMVKNYLTVLYDKIDYLIIVVTSQSETKYHRWVDELRDFVHKDKILFCKDIIVGNCGYTTAVFRLKRLLPLIEGKKVDINLVFNSELYSLYFPFFYINYNKNFHLFPNFVNFNDKNYILEFQDDCNKFEIRKVEKGY